MKSELQKKFAMMVVGCLVVAGGGAVLLIVGFRKYQEREAFRGRAWAADGTVTGFAYETSGTGNPEDATLFTLVQFELEGGEEIEFRGPARNGIIDLHQGDTVRVLYDPADPSRARVDSFMGMWLTPTLFWLAGGLVVLAAVATLYETWRWSEQHAAKPLPEINRLPWRP